MEEPTATSTAVVLVESHGGFHVGEFELKLINCCYFFLFLQESDGQKTNNGIQYRLQLLYANGELLYLGYFVLKK